MNHIQTKILALLMLALATAANANWNGTVSEPENTSKIDDKTYYELTSPEELAWFAGRVNSGDTLNGILMNDISLYSGDVDSTKTYSWTPIGKDSLTMFNGVFDGAGHTISGVYVKSSLAGLFGFIGNGAVVKNIKIDNALILTNGTAGVLAAVNKGMISSAETSGLVATIGLNPYAGYIKKTTVITNASYYDWDTHTCTGSSGNEKCTYYYTNYIDTVYQRPSVFSNVGGGVGLNVRLIDHLTNNAKVQVDSSNKVSSFYASSSSVGTYHCLSSSSNNGAHYYYRNIIRHRYETTSSENQNLGGVAAYNQGTILNSQNSGTIAAVDYNSAGVTGASLDGFLQNNKNSGTVLGSYSGGIVGLSQGDSLLENQNSGQITSLSALGTGGIAGKAKLCFLQENSNLGLITGSQYVAGVVGNDSGSVIRHSINSGVVSGTESVGGIAGYSRGDSLFYATNSGAIKGGGYAGGLVGRSDAKSYLEHLINKGNVLSSGSYVGSLVGSNGGVLTASYTVIDSLRGFSVGGIAGSNSGKAYNIYVAVDSIKGTRGGLFYSNSSSTSKDLYYDSEVSGLDSMLYSGTVLLYSGSFETSVMKSAKFAWQLNTVTGTEANSKIWSFNGDYPVFATSVLMPAYRVIFDNDGAKSTRYSGSDGKVQNFLEDPTATGATFIGWSFGSSGQLLTVNSVITADTTVTALFSSDARYTVTFNNSNGSQLYAYLANANGVLPSFPADPTPADTAYFFSGWFDSEGVQFTESSVVTANTTVTAQYLKKSGVTYMVTFANEDGSTLKADTLTYGTKPVYDGAMPTKAATAQYTYAFTGWTPDVVAATANATYKAVYSSTVNKYAVTFKNWNGDVLEKDSLEYGATPSYSGVTPGRSATAAATYAFSSWTPTIASITGDAAYMATFANTPTTFKVTFIVSGAIVKTETVDYGTAATAPENPIKAATDNYSYTFTGWNTDFSNVTSGLTVTALFSSSARKYLVQFYNNETLLESDSVAYGTIPGYTGTTLTKTATAKYSYVFKTWSPAVAAVTGAATYMAVFDSTLNSYTVAFKNGTTTLQTGSVAYGTIPGYTGTTPTKAATDKYAYTFKTWSPAVAAVTGAATYMAVFDSTLNSYTVAFKNGTTTLQTSSVAYGATTVYTGTTPTKAATDKYAYTFKTWSPAVAAVTGAATYMAVFDSTLNSYTVAFKNGTTTLQTGSVAYGTIPSYTGATPVQAADATYTYKFNGWTPTVTAVTGSATYTATFSGTKLSSSSVASSSSSEAKSSSSAAKSSSSEPPTIVAASAVPHFALSVTGRTLNVQNAAVNSRYAVMDAQGRVLSCGVVQNAEFTLAFPGAGAYFVRIGALTRAVRVR